MHHSMAKAGSPMSCGSVTASSRLGDSFSACLPKRRFLPVMRRLLGGGPGLDNGSTGFDASGSACFDRGK